MNSKNIPNIYSKKCFKHLNRTTNEEKNFTEKVEIYSVNKESISPT